MAMIRTHRSFIVINILTRCSVEWQWEISLEGFESLTVMVTIKGSNPLPRFIGYSTRPAGQGNLKKGLGNENH